jgi:hypothetical protein
MGGHMTHDSDDAIDGTTGLSRRDILRRSALVGGTLVWAAPTVQALAVPAYAGSEPTPPGDFVPVPCALKIALKWTPAKDGAAAFFEPNYTNDAGDCEPDDPNASVTRSIVSLGAGSTGTHANLFVGSTYLGTLDVSATSTPFNGCYLFDFNLLPCYNVSESSSYYVVKDGNDAGSTGAQNCEDEDRGFLNTDDPDPTDPTYTPTNAASDQYTFCGEVDADGSGATGGGLSHVGLVLCIDQVAECQSA